MEALMQRMTALADKNEKLSFLRPNSDCYYHLACAYASLRQPQRAEACIRYAKNQCDAQPTMWRPVLEAWSKSRDRLAVPKATAIVQTLETSEEESNCPDVQMYNLLLNCYANDSRNSLIPNANQAQELLEMMESGWCVGPDGVAFTVSCKPDEFSYDIVLRAWCRADSLDHAESLLRLWYHDKPASGEDAVPTARHFATVMEGWANNVRNSKECDRSLGKIEQLLKDMQELHSTKGFSTKPDLEVYNIFLKALSHSQGNDSPDRAETVLKQLKENGLIPNAFTYNNVLSSWLRSSRSDAPTKASELLEEMRAIHSNENKVINPVSLQTVMEIYSRHNLPLKAQEMFEMITARGRKGTQTRRSNFEANF
jgi:hypothetical protein